MDEYLIVGKTVNGDQISTTADTMEMAEVIGEAMYDSGIEDIEIISIQRIGHKEVISKSNEVPSKETIFEYLDELRETGITNMFGAIPYIMSEFDGITKQEATEFLAEWMRTFSSRKQVTTK